MQGGSKGAVLSDEQNRNEMVAAAGKRAPGKKVAGKAETTMRDRERGRGEGHQGRCRTVVMSCPVLLSPGRQGDNHC